MPPYKKSSAEKLAEVRDIAQIYPRGFFDKYADKTFDEVLSDMANTPEEKGLIAVGILNSIKLTGDPSALKILQTVLDKQGLGVEKEIPISDEKFKEIIKTASRRL